MKIKNIKLKILAIIISIIAGSCIDYYKITTKVNPDGSLTRTIQVVGDSTDIFDGQLKVPSDSSLWEISGKWIHKVPGDTSSEKQYEFTATRNFSNVEELNNFLSIDTDTSAYIKAKTEFRKSFRWFYTYINFAETYIKKMPFNHVEIDQYMTEDEYSFYYDDEFIYSPAHDSLIHIADLESMPALTHQDSLRGDELEEKITLKFIDWYTRNVFEEYFNLTLDEMQVRMPENHQKLIENKEELYETLEKFEGLFFESKEKENPMLVIADFLELSEDSIKRLNPPVFDVFYKKLDITNDIAFESHKIKNMIEMPGILIKTNADSISSNKTYWNYNNSRNFAKDYTLYSESRMVNKWAFVVTGIVIIMLLGFILKGFIRK